MINTIDNVHTEIIQYVSSVFSLLFIAFIIELIRKRKLREEYSLLWLFLGFVFLILSIWRKSLEIIAIHLGVAYAPAALFLIIIAILIVILIHYSVVISRLKENMKVMVQEIGIIRLEIKKYQKKNKS